MHEKCMDLRDRNIKSVSVIGVFANVFLLAISYSESFKIDEASFKNGL